MIQQDKSVHHFEGLEEFERLHTWRFFWDWLWCFLPICLMIYVIEVVRFEFYFLFLYFIGNRAYRMSTLGHEGLHHLISKNQELNTFLARYFCHFPTFTSHSRYKNLHILHHRYLGQDMDPDKYLYKDYPKFFKPWILKVIWELVTFRMLFDFAVYYTDLLDIGKFLFRRKNLKLKLVKSDLAQYLVFWTICFSLISIFGLWKYFLLYWVLPIYLHLPIIQLTNGLQHGAFKSLPQARTQVDSFWLIDWFIPLDLNFHYEHHLNPRIPHYKLRKFSNYLVKNGRAPFQNHSTLSESLRLILKRSSP